MPFALRINQDSEAVDSANKADNHQAAGEKGGDIGAIHDDNSSYTEESDRDYTVKNNFFGHIFSPSCDGGAARRLNSC